jgi:hypothetical protein
MKLSAINPMSLVVFHASGRRFVMTKSLILFLFLIVGCGHIDERYTPTFEVVDYGEFKEYVDDFKTIIALHDIEVKYKTLVSIGWVPQEGNTLGLCYFYRDYRYNSPSWITISEKLKDSPNRLRWTVFHELGHCFMGLDHSQRDTSLMYQYVPKEIDTPMMNEGIKEMIEEIQEMP